MGAFPVVFISLKNVDELTFEEARYQLAEILAMEAERFDFLMYSDRLSENDRKKYKALIEIRDGQYAMDGIILTSALQTLSMLLCRHYGRKTIICKRYYNS